MSRIHHWIRCTTDGCNAKYSSYDYPTQESFRRAVTDNGWGVCPPLCPACNSGDTSDGPGDDRMLVVPLAQGAFTAYAPQSMTSADWRVIQGICGAMAAGCQGGQNLPSDADATGVGGC